MENANVEEHIFSLLYSGQAENIAKKLTTKYAKQNP